MAFKKLYNHAKLDEFGSVVGASAAIFDQETGENLVAQLVGDYRQVADTELVQAVLDNFFKRTYADRAMSEAVQTVDELKQKTKEFDKQISDAKTEIEMLKNEIVAEIRGETEKNREMVRVVTMTVNELLAQLDVDEEAEDETEPTNETTEE
ncbi:septal ring factor EnvC (AmiA/AmiB activator) [Streptococcus rupicaprae]|uniref:Septal ring factor EnvC (AmiA/AmiB activator) n=1 Tax=Streptococcus rupicaprae TaxID=759619 RepID=A0ABV2FJJ0_9STRE